MNDDRNYYRMMEDHELVELAKSVKTSELAIVLGERLKRANRKLETGRYDEAAYRNDYDSQY